MFSGKSKTVDLGNLLVVDKGWRTSSLRKDRMKEWVVVVMGLFSIIILMVAVLLLVFVKMLRTQNHSG